MVTKPILCLDFDGVIHSYASGWKGASVISDPPVDGALVFIVDALERFDVQIFSSRSHQTGGVRAMRNWLREQFAQELNMHVARVEEIMATIKWPTEKPPALVTIDDRALTFTGEWPSLEYLANFKPWNG